MTNLDSIFKSRDITLPTKVHLVKAMVCPVVMYECESWTIKKAECRRIDTFELWWWRRLLRGKHSSSSPRHLLSWPLGQNKMICSFMNYSLRRNGLATIKTNPCWAGKKHCIFWIQGCLRTWMKLVGFWFINREGEPKGWMPAKPTLFLFLIITLPDRDYCPWCWERLRAGGEGGDRGWDGWMASLTQWTCVWANLGR